MSCSRFGLRQTRMTNRNLRGNDVKALLGFRSVEAAHMALHMALARGSSRAVSKWIDEVAIKRYSHREISLKRSCCDISLQCAKFPLACMLSEKHQFRRRPSR